MKVLIGSKNPGKILGAKLAFENYFGNVEIEGIDVPSGVPDQPIDDETVLGAKMRVKKLKSIAQKENIKADYFVAIESGLVNLFGNYEIVNFAVIEDNENLQSYGTSAGFPIPQNFVPKIKEIGLSNFMDTFFFEDKERHNGKGGIGLLTKDKISRIDLNYQAFVMALIEVLNKGWRD